LLPLRVDFGQNSQIFHTQKHTKSPPNIYEDLGEPPRFARRRAVRGSPIGSYLRRRWRLGTARKRAAPTIPLAA
jgi:hypothetical protein